MVFLCFKNPHSTKNCSWITRYFQLRTLRTRCSAPGPQRVLRLRSLSRALKVNFAGDNIFRPLLDFHLRIKLGASSQTLDRGSTAGACWGSNPSHQAGSLFSIVLHTVSHPSRIVSTRPSDRDSICQQLAGAPRLHLAVISVFNPLTAVLFLKRVGHFVPTYLYQNNDFWFIWNRKFSAIKNQVDTILIDILLK